MPGHGRGQEEPSGARLLAGQASAHGSCSSNQRRLVSMRSTSWSRSWRASSRVLLPRTASSAATQTRLAICSHSGILGVARVWSSWARKAAALGSAARRGSFQAARWLGRLQQEGHQQAGRLLIFGVAEDDQAGAPGQACPRPRVGHAGQRRCAPGILQFGGQATAELAQVPGTGNVHGEGAAFEFLVQVGDLVVAHRRAPALGKDGGVKIEGLPEFRAAEIPARAVSFQQRRARFQSQGHGLGPFVQRQQDGVAAGSALLGHRPHGLPPAGPGAGELIEPCLPQNIRTVVDDPCIHIPGHTVQRAGDDVGFPDAGEVVGGIHGRAGGHPAVQGRQRAKGGELRHPGVAQLGHVRHGAAHVRGQQLLVSGGPGDLLHDHADVRVRGLEVAHQFLDHFAFAAHGPEAQGGHAGISGAGISSLAAGHQQGDGQHDGQRDGQRLHARTQLAQAQPAQDQLAPAQPAYLPHHGRSVTSSSQPPVNPARFSPRVMCGLRRRVFQTSPLRRFSIMITMGPWSIPR